MRPGETTSGGGLSPSEAALARLLGDGAAYDCEYGSGLTNHLPMALLALQRLGASPERLQSFAAAYAPRLAPAPAAKPWPAGDAWPPRLGQRAAWAAYRSLFAEWVACEGARDTLGQVLPGLWVGCGAAGFHGPIRLAAAVRAGHPGEVADALAYWASRHLRLWTEGAPRKVAPAGRASSRRAVVPSSDPVPLLRALPAVPSRARRISHRMAEAARVPQVAAVAGALEVDAHTPADLARAAALAYACSGDFTALHLVTGTHAVRVLARFVDDPVPAWQGLWGAFVCAVASAGLRASTPPEPLPWDTLVARAVAGEDEHVMKLVDSCREEEKAHATPGETLWRAAATRAVQG